MAIHGDIRINHRKIGDWQAVCQPGSDGIHPYRWGATVNGVTVRGELVHARSDGALVLVAKVTAAAAIALAEATRGPEGLATPDVDSGKGQAAIGPQIVTQPPDLVAALRASVEAARIRRQQDERRKDRNG